jgi:hypothetical protein
MEIKLLEIFGFVSALTALRLPHKNTESDSQVFLNQQEHGSVGSNYDNYLTLAQKFQIGNKDLKLMQALIKKGDDHAKVMRGIIVSLEINAPRYFWAEMDTYNVGRISLGSESTMHCEAKGLTGLALQKMKSNLKEGHHQKRVIEFSYQTLRRIYFQRKNHRLPEWTLFCDFIKTLPFAKELITIS